MRSLPVGLAVVLLMVSGSASEAKKAAPKSQSSVAQLKHSLRVIASAATPTSATPKTIDRDQGDDHASLNAIQNVCSKTTPAARRSAICPVSISPE